MQVWRTALKALKERLQRDAARGGLGCELLDQKFAVQVELVDQESIRRKHVDIVRLHRCRREVPQVVCDDCVCAAAHGGRQDVPVLRVVRH
jgi:hypothetical protein